MKKWLPILFLFFLFGCGKKLQLLPPDNLYIDNNILYWDKMDSASFYSIIVKECSLSGQNRIVYETSNNYFNLGFFEINRIYQIAIKSGHENYLSDYSPTVIYHTFSDICKIVETSWNKYPQNNLKIIYKSSIYYVEDLDTSYYEINSGNLILYASYLNTLDLGDYSFVLITDEGLVNLNINIYECKKPKIISDNNVTYCGEDVILYFELYDGVIKSISGNLSTDDYTIEHNKLTIKHEFIDRKFAEIDNIIFSYIIVNHSEMTLGYIFIKK